MWVVKLGGSLADADELPDWLNALAQTKAIIVPGGGPFADAVRLAQRRWRFDDRSAHDMAILAMNQYGRLLTGLCPALTTATDLDDIKAKADRPTVWLPSIEQLDAAGITASWDITSDSLAAWLASSLGASNLLLVKSVVCRPGSALPVDQLKRDGVIDAAFPDPASASSIPAWLCGRAAADSLPAGLRHPDRHFARIV